MGNTPHVHRTQTLTYTTDSMLAVRLEPSRGPN